MIFPDLWCDPNPVMAFRSDLMLAQSLGLTCQLLAIRQENG